MWLLSPRVFLTTRRRRHAGKAYEYLDIAESHRVDGKVRRTTLWTLGRRDQIDPDKIKGLIRLLQQLVSAEGASAMQIGGLEIASVREYGVVFAARERWRRPRLPPLSARDGRHPSASPGSGGQDLRARYRPLQPASSAGALRPHL